MTLPIPASVRRAPAQKRSQDRMTALLDSTARLVDRYGVHRVTTGDIARESRSSVGVIYRYFDNVAGMFDALAVRNVKLLRDRLDSALGPEPCTWDAASRALVESLTSLMQNEPGFRVLGLGDSHHQGVQRDSRNRRYLARTLADRLRNQYPASSDDDLLLYSDTAIEIAYSLLRRAYSEEGEAREGLRRITSEIVRGLAPRR